MPEKEMKQPWGLPEAGCKGWRSWYFLALAILPSQLSANARGVQIPLGHEIGTPVLTQQADRSPGCTRGRRQAQMPSASSLPWACKPKSTGTKGTHSAQPAVGPDDSGPLSSRLLDQPCPFPVLLGFGVGRLEGAAEGPLLIWMTIPYAASSPFCHLQHDDLPFPEVPFVPWDSNHIPKLLPMIL